MEKKKKKDEPNHSFVSASEKRWQKDACEIQEILKKVGWLDQSPETLSPNDEPFTPQSALQASSWKTIIQTEKQHIINQKYSGAIINVSHIVPPSFKPNIVEVVDKSYLEQKYHTTEHNVSINQLCDDFSLNKQQAFKIVANHVVIPYSEPLKMYIGGMGGTGKSHVLEAISSFFNIKKESYRFITVAPTGTAAALISGSTYHSVFGINEMSNEVQTTKTLVQVHTRLQGVDYVFMDEVSMLSAHDMFKISAQLCKVMNNPTTPFGGLSMLFAGDFAQLPPPMGGENVSLYSCVIGFFATDKKSQEEALGKVLWHLIVENASKC